VKTIYAQKKIDVERVARFVDRKENIGEELWNCGDCIKAWFINDS